MKISIVNALMEVPGLVIAVLTVMVACAEIQCRRRGAFGVVVLLLGVTALLIGLGRAIENILC